MKKQLTTAILFAFILLGCKKEDVTINEQSKTLNNPPPIVKRDPVTLPVVILHSTGKVSFGWEYGTNKEDGPLTVSGIVVAMGAGGSWLTTETYWSNYPSNPNVLNIRIFGAYVYYATGSFGVDKVSVDVIIFITYDVKSHVKTVTVKSTGETIVKK